MSYEYSLVAIFPGHTPTVDAVRKAATSLGLSPAEVGSSDPRLLHDGLLIHARDSFDDERALTRKHFGFENNMTLIFSDFSSSDDAMMIRVMQNILTVVQGFCEDPAFCGVLVAEYENETYLARVEHGEMILNRLYWDDWAVTPEILSGLSAPHQFGELRLS